MSKPGTAHKKLAPFKYPTKKHKRTESPPQFSKYRDFKPFLKREFEGKCVYCCKLDLHQDPSAFHTEHYKPKNEKMFPDLETEYTNLFYSCAACNRRKGTYWHEDPKMRVLNPCDYVMSHHLGFNDNAACFHTPQGELNVELLSLNNDESLAYRKHQLELVRLLITMLFEHRNAKDPAKIVLMNRAIRQVSELTGQTETRVRTICNL